jgi:hypothetical protein
MKKRMLVHPIGFPMIRCVELDLCGAKTYDIEEGLMMVIEQKKNTIVLPYNGVDIKKLLVHFINHEVCEIAFRISGRN